MRRSWVDGNRDVPGSLVDLKPEEAVVLFDRPGELTSILPAHVHVQAVLDEGTLHACKVVQGEQDNAWNPHCRYLISKRVSLKWTSY